MPKPKNPNPAPAEAEPAAPNTQPKTHLAGLYCPHLSMGKTIRVGQQYGDPLLENRPKNDPQKILSIKFQGAGYKVNRSNGTHFIVPLSMAIPVWQLDEIELPLEDWDIRHLGRLLFEKGIGKALADKDAKDFPLLGLRATKYGQMQAAKDIAAMSRADYVKADDEQRLSKVRDDEGNLPTQDDVEAGMAGLDDEEESDGGKLGEQIRLAQRATAAK